MGKKFLIHLRRNYVRNNVSNVVKSAWLTSIGRAWAQKQLSRTRLFESAHSAL